MCNMCTQISRSRFTAVHMEKGMQVMNSTIALLTQRNVTKAKKPYFCPLLHVCMCVYIHICIYKISFRIRIGALQKYLLWKVGIGLIMLRTMALNISAFPFSIVYIWSIQYLRSLGLTLLAVVYGTLFSYVFYDFINHLYFLNFYLLGVFDSWLAWKVHFFLGTFMCVGVFVFSCTWKHLYPVGVINNNFSAHVTSAPELHHAMHGLGCGCKF